MGFLCRCQVGTTRLGQLYLAACGGTADQPALSTFLFLVIKGQMNLRTGWRGNVPENPRKCVHAKTQPPLPISGLIITEKGGLEDK